jgi:Domain of unknown function (DUF4296)
MKHLFFIIISVLLFSCSDSNLPRGILSPEKMEIMLWEQMKADAFTKEYISKASSKNLVVENIKLQQKLFDKYKIDKEDFYNSYQYYLKHDALLKDVLDSIVAKQTRIHQKEFEQKMSGKRVNDYEDIFKLKEILKPRTVFKMQDSLKFPDVVVKKGINLKIDSVAEIQLKRRGRNFIKPSLQAKNYKNIL